MGKMNEIQISSNEPKEGKALILQGAERNEAYFAKCKPDTSGPGSEMRVGALRSIQITHKENEMNWQSKLRMCILYRSIQS